MWVKYTLIWNLGLPLKAKDFVSHNFFVFRVLDINWVDITVPPRSFHTNINYFRGTVKKKKIWGGKCEMWNKQN